MASMRKRYWGVLELVGWRDVDRAFPKLEAAEAGVVIV